MNFYNENWFRAIENSFIFVWCDASVGTTLNPEDDRNTILQLTYTVNQSQRLVHTFNDINLCRQFIEQVNNVCLIISGTMGQELVPLIHSLDQIHSIYIFCINQSKHEQWSSNYRKVRGVYTNINVICDSLKSALVPRSPLIYDYVEFDVVPQSVNYTPSDQQDLILINSKLMKLILRNMDSPDHGMKDMLQYYRAEYTTNYQTLLINEIERKYSNHDAIWWYSRDCFLQGVLNRALRTHDLYALCSIHRFLKDVDNQLTQLYNSQRTTNGILKLYFGQFLTTDTFQRIKDGRKSFLCANNFIHANLQEVIAMMFLKTNHAAVPKEQKIRALFQISIDQSEHSIVPYANIGAVSQFVHEREYLISMGAVFRIDAVERLKDLSSAWMINLTMISQNDPRYSQLTQCVQTDAWEEKINLSELGHTIHQRLHLFKAANKLLLEASMSSKNKNSLLILHYNMAVILSSIHEHEKALEEYRYALVIARKFIPNCQKKDDLCLIAVYGNMAQTLQQANRCSQAVEHAFRALSIISNEPSESDVKRDLYAICYHNLGSIYDQANKYAEARKFYEHALRIRQEYLPIGHPDVTVLQRNITLLADVRHDSI